MIVLGLTGSIGMGKSTTAQMFRDAGVPVHDSDEAVHRLYEGAAVGPVGAAFPEVIVDGRVDRARLTQRVVGDPASLKRLEAIVHPLVRADTAAFVDGQRAVGAPLVVIDVPLLFETGGEGRVDKVLVVTAPAEVQRQRVLARSGMTADKFDAILARQMPDAEKRRRADYVIDTGEGMDAARQAVRRIVAELTGGRQGTAPV